MIADTGKVADGKPATGRLCQAGLREKASVRHLAWRLTGYRKESSTNSRDNVQGNSSPQRSERRGTERLDYRTSEGRVLATWFRKADRVVARTPVGRDRRNRRASRPPSVGASGAIAGVLGAYLLFFPTARLVVVFPIFFFILPSMLVVAAGPGILQIFKYLFPMMKSLG